MLWLLTRAGVLERRVDDGSAWTLTHQRAVSTAGPPLAIDGDDVWFADGMEQLTKAHPEVGGTLSLTSLPRPAQLSVSALAAGPGGLLVWSDRQGSEPSVTHISPSGKATIRSMALPNAWPSLVAVDHDKFWLVRRNELKNTLFAFVPTTDGMSEAVAELPRYADNYGVDFALAMFPRSLFLGPTASPYPNESQLVSRPATVVPGSRRLRSCSMPSSSAMTTSTSVSSAVTTPSRCRRTGSP